MTELPVRVSRLAQAGVYYHVLEAEQALAKAHKLRQSTRKRITQGIAFCRRIVERGLTGAPDRRASVQLGFFEQYRRQIRRTNGAAYDAMTALIHAALVADCLAAALPYEPAPSPYFKAPVPGYVEIDFENEVRAAIFHATGRLKVPKLVLEIFSLYWRMKAYEPAYAYARFSVENLLDGSTEDEVQPTVEGRVQGG